MDDRNFTDKETVMRFLREASIAMILSSNPGIDDWIAEAQLDVLEGSWARLNATSWYEMKFQVNTLMVKPCKYIDSCNIEALGRQALLFTQLLQ